jgi:hypothetical protein
MPSIRTLTSGAPALGLALALLTGAAQAETMVANCTGMFNLDIYRIDTTLPVQDVEGLGRAELVMDEDAVVLTGSFGEYKFDRKLGTLYVDGSDSGIYCTWSSPRP